LPEASALGVAGAIGFTPVPAARMTKASILSKPFTTFTIDGNPTTATGINIQGCPVNPHDSRKHGTIGFAGLV